MHSYKELLSALAIALTFAMFVPYIRSIRAGLTKPHVFSWVIWAIGTFVVCLAQLAGEGGLGAWPIGVSGIVSAYIAVLAYRRRADTAITRSDWMFLVAALAALLFPAAVGAACLAFVALVAYRRKALAHRDARRGANRAIIR
jgi:hypothetical protein